MKRSRERNKIKDCINVEKAWKILDEAYGDETQFIETLIVDLENVDTYETKGRINLNAMEKFVQSLQNFSTQMESLGVKVDLNSKVILAHVRRKLPEDHRISFLKDVRDNRVDESIFGLVQWFHSHLVLLQKARDPTTSSTENSSKPVKYHKSTNHSTMSSGGGVRNYNNTMNRSDDDEFPPKCLLYPQSSNHYIKGCNKFRSLTQGEKFDIMKTNNICQRCGHNNCVAGKYPYNYDNCQFVSPCQIPTCRRDTLLVNLSSCLWNRWLPTFREKT